MEQTNWRRVREKVGKVLTNAVRVLKNRQQKAVVAIRMLGRNVTPTFPICSKSVSFREVCATKANIPASTGLWPSAWMLDVFGQEVIHVIADAVAKGVTDFPHTVKSGDQAIAAVRG
jgi:hypothetical protein